jgi:hypothetical protein
MPPPGRPGCSSQCVPPFTPLSFVLIIFTRAVYVARLVRQQISISRAILETADIITSVLVAAIIALT